VSLVVTLLTGLRPDLLTRTLESVRVHHPHILEDAFVLVLHNGGDLPTTQVLDQHRDVIDLVVTTPFQTIGPSVSSLFRHALEVDADLLLHLEDDWQAYPSDPWLAEAVDLLEAGVFQVRLRHYTERVLTRHMVTGKPIRWRTKADYRITDDAHYTLNPSLMRLADVKAGWPATSERDAQDQFWQAGLRKVAQVQGLFRHIGGADSLRLR